MIINQGNLAAIYQGFETIFNAALRDTPTIYERVAMRVNRPVEENIYAWLGNFPMMRQWVGDRVVKNLKANKYSLVNKPYEATIELDRDDILYDKIGLYAPLISEFSRNVATHADFLVFSALMAGVSEICYDGEFFFDTDHPVGTGTTSNEGGGATGIHWFLMDVTRAIKPLIYQVSKEIEFVSLDQPSDENVFKTRKYLYGADYSGAAGYGLWQLAYHSQAALDATSYAAARAAMLAFKDDNGVPLNIQPNLLVTEPAGEASARSLLKSMVNASGASNPWFETAELIVTPWLA